MFLMSDYSMFLCKNINRTIYFKNRSVVCYIHDFVGQEKCTKNVSNKKDCTACQAVMVIAKIMDIPIFLTFIHSILL